MANYEDVNMADMQAESDRLTSKGNANDLFVQMPEGEGFLELRLLPPLKGKPFFQASRIHKVNGKNFHCPRELVNRDGKKRWEDADRSKPCPYCKMYNEEYEAAKKMSGKEAEKAKKEAKAKWKPYERYYYAVMVREEVNLKTKEVKKNVGPKVWAAGEKLHEMVVTAYSGDPRFRIKPIGNVANVLTGRDLNLVKKMSKGDDGFEYPDYTKSQWLDASPLGTPEEIEKWMSNLPDLSKLRIVKPYEEMITELQKALGVIKDDTDTFDTQKMNQSLESQVQQAQATQVTQATETSVTAASDEVMLEEDWVRELRSK